MNLSPDYICLINSEHRKWIDWNRNWTGRTAGVVRCYYYSNYIGRVLVRRVDLDLLGCPCLHSVVYLDHRLVQVRIKFDKSNVRMAGYWKFNISLLNGRDIRDQLLLIIQRKLTGTVFENKWWGHLKDTIYDKATNMAAKLLVGELHNASDRHIACVISPNERTLATDNSICQVFCNYFQKFSPGSLV